MNRGEIGDPLSQSAERGWARVERALREQKRLVYLGTSVLLALLFGLYVR